MKAVEDVGGSPAFAVVDTDFVWVADWSTPRVVRLSAVGPARPGSISLPVRDVFAGVWSIAASTNGVWATTPYDGALWHINPRTSAVTRVNVPYSPTGVAADANDVWVTVRKY